MRLGLLEGVIQLNSHALPLMGAIFNEKCRVNLSEIVHGLFSKRINK